MKATLFCLFILLSLNLVKAQGLNSPYPDARVKANWFLGDFLFNGDLTFGADYRISKRHALGLSLGYLQDRDEIYSESKEVFWRGTDSRLYHSVYLFRPSKDNFIYARHGFRFKEGNFHYPVTAYYPFEENGNTYLKKDTRTQNLNSRQIGYELVLGLEINYHLFFVSYYIGASFNKAYWRSPLSTPAEDQPLYDPRFSGTRPVAGIRIGFYLY